MTDDGRLANEVGGRLPASVEIVEVGLRDGLQDEDVIIETEQKLALVDLLVDAGLDRLEVVSFASPKRVPQMADAEEVAAQLERRRGPRFSGLVLNERGLDRAQQSGIREINVPVVVTDEFSLRNQGMTTDAAVEMWLSVAARAASVGIRASVTLSAAFGCPYTGRVPLESVQTIAARVAVANPDEIILADTIGCAVPNQVGELVASIAERTSTAVRCHFHNSRNTGLANAVAALEAGVTSLDASIGGLGGCPFAPGAAGNIPTEDLVYMLHGMGVQTGIDLERLLRAASRAQALVGHELAGMVVKAGNFPPAHDARAAS